ncbi:MAG: sigma-54 interaction domain-containing protein [bacterium]
MSRSYTDIILGSIADGVFTVDREWNILSFNRAAEKITGVPKSLAIGQKCFEVFRADICQNACALKRTIESGKELIDLRINILNSKGYSVPVSISTAVLRDEHGLMVGGVETFRDLSMMERLRKEIHHQYTFADIISKNHEIQKILDILPDIAMSDSTVLIVGPSGSGKELVAKAIHHLSRRKRKRYVAVNCGALPDTLLESELFGYVRGAFTDARKDKPGRFALAEGGTLFLDEIGDLSVALQVKLLRVLQEKEYEPLGATAPVKADVRIIAATNKSLPDLLSGGVFREDLYYRLNVVKISLPPLSSRREDIPLLIDHFIQRFNASKGKDIQGVSELALALLMRYDYPGNVRELENIVEHCFVLCRGGEIQADHLPREVVSTRSREVSEPMANPLRQAEAATIINTLQKYHGNRRKTASDLGLHKTTLWRKMKKYGITSFES